MRAHLARRLLSLAPLTALLLVPAAAVHAQGRIIVVNADGPGEGFNDPTPAAPVGGNPGTTRGQQRLNVFQAAADVWADLLKPTTDVFVQATFDVMPANILGVAGTTFVFHSFPGAELPGTWYHSALADKLAGVDLNPGFADIGATFNSAITFYLGLDNDHGALTDLLVVVLHELGHGLGFANFVNEVNGALFMGRPDVYSQYTLDVTTGRTWNEMTDSGPPAFASAERAASALNVRKVSWSGRHVNQAVPQVLSPGEPMLRVLSPAGLGPFLIGTAAFGAALTADGVSGSVVQALDGVGVAADGCEALTNAAEVAGNIALVDRGGPCGFTVKVKNAQDAGAMAALIADNVAGSPPAGLGGVDPTITIPSARMTLADGNTLKASLAVGVQANMGLDLSVLAGTDRVRGLMMVAALDPVALGSSISHYEAVAFRNQLMEPGINPDLTHSVQPPEDLTLPQLIDVGWFSDHDGVADGVDACLGSDLRPSVVVAGCDSGVPNTLSADGCSIGDRVKACSEGATNHGGFVSCVAHLTNGLVASGLISGKNKGAIQSCAARSRP